MAIFNVRNASQLQSAISAAKAGDVIALAPGSYSNVVINGLNKAGAGVTITSQDPNKPAVLNDLLVKGSSGFTFTNLELFARKDMAFQVQSSSNVNLDKLFVHGTLNGSSNDDVRGMLIRDSKNVVVSNSRFTELTDAVSHIDSNNVTFTNNNFSTIRDNGISGGGTSQLKILGNVFTNFDHVGDVHPDAIQVWTTNTKAAASDITIAGNSFDRGTGAAVQGIWMRDEVGNLPFRNVTITDNKVVGGAFNGIAVMGAENVTFARNVVAGYTDQLSWIGVTNVKNAIVTDNIATEYQFNNSGVSQSGNVLAQQIAQLSDGAARLTVTRAGLVDDLASNLTLLGYVDAPSTTKSYRFTEVTVTGTAGADRLTAGAVGDYRLIGGDGDDTLSGGGTGRHTLVGGKGNDTYVITKLGETAVEAAGEGIDTVVTSVDYTLGANIENARADRRAHHPWQRARQQPDRLGRRPGHALRLGRQ